MFFITAAFLKHVPDLTIVVRPRDLWKERHPHRSQWPMMVIGTSLWLFLRYLWCFILSADRHLRHHPLFIVYIDMVPGVTHDSDISLRVVEYYYYYICDVEPMNWTDSLWVLFLILFYSIYLIVIVILHSWTSKQFNVW